jgi:hypothetical protein
LTWNKAGVVWCNHSLANVMSDARANTIQ